MSDKVTLTREELREVMSEAVQEAFTQMGFDTESPLEVQKDMAHVRRWRIAVEGAQTQTFRSIIGILAVGCLGALWLGVKTILNQQ